VAEITAAAVKALRERTGAGMMDCKGALKDAGGDVEAAIGVLRERGLAKAVKRSGRETSEGAIALAVDGAAGAIVELGCETDFVAKTPDFQSLASALSASAAADAGIDGVDALLDATVDGRKVSDRIAEAVSTMGENIVLKRVVRLEPEGDGVAGGYVHAGGKLGVLVALSTSAKGAEVDALAKDLAMHVAAADPSPVALDRSGVPEDLLERERVLFRRQAEADGKPEKVIDKIVEGRVRKFYSEICLIEQPFVKDPDQTVGKVVESVAGAIGGDIAVAGFVRFKLGESPAGDGEAA
jgi:elongation factor Ts